MSLAQEQSAELSLADAHRLRQHALEHLFQRARRARNDLQHFRGGSLLLTRLIQFAAQDRDLALHVSNRWRTGARSLRGSATVRGRSLAAPRLHCSEARRSIGLTDGDGPRTIGLTIGVRSSSPRMK